MSRLAKLSQAAAALFAAAMLLAPVQASAALKCEELVNKRICTDSAPKAYLVDGGQTVYVSAPVISGYSTPCWNWQRQFQCVETDPIYTCDPVADFPTVKDTCSLTQAAITSTVTVRSITYITEANYTYRCPFGEFQTDDALPVNQECVLLDSTTSDTGSSAAAPTGTIPSTGTGSPPKTATINGSTVTDQEKVDSYVCYFPPQTTCSDICYKTVINQATGQVEQVEEPCSAPVSNCTIASDQCTGTVTRNADGTYTGDMDLGPDGRCVNSEAIYTCQSGEIPRCLESENCTLESTAPSDIQPNGFPLTQTQNYICSNQTESCAETTTISNCVHANAWGWDNLTIKSQVGEGLGDFNQALARLDAVEKGMKGGDIYIFSGYDRRCKYPVGSFINTLLTIAFIAVTVIASGGTSIGALGNLAATQLSAATGMAMSTAQAVVASAQIGASAVVDAVDSKAFGTDCCKTFVIEGSDGPFRFGSCTVDEVKLAVSRRKGLYHYIGQYCSKKGGFPIRECKEKTRTYCTFDDMLALTVNEQGRRQLDQLASADTTTTQSSPLVESKLFNVEIENPTKYTGMNNGRWIPVTTFNKSQIWMWQYPGYCVSQEKQAAAYTLYQAELNESLDLQGIQPEEMTQEEAAAYLIKNTQLPVFQDCGDTPGLASFLTCSKTDDTCDTTKLPENPTDIEVDESGSEVVSSDINWRVQQIQTFYSPGDYGVTSTLPEDSTYAAVSDSLNEYVTATGSCHADGACKYLYAVTDKTANNSLGARKRVKDYAQFPLYMYEQSAVWPTIDYLSPEGVLDNAARLADPNLGAGTPITVSKQRFLFHPNDITKAPADTIHSKVLLDWTGSAFGFDQENNYTPILVPTSLPPATAGFYPYGNPADNNQHFYLSGGCDPNSKWCDYTIEVDLSVPRHPWGTAKRPRCWGFTIEQMAALDFDKMDLSKWIDSLNLDSAADGLSAEAAQAMSNQVTASAQSFYSAFKSGDELNKPNPGTTSLVVNTNVVPMTSSTEASSYTVHMAVPANWPNWFDTAANNNPVTDVWVNWGDGSAPQQVPKSSTGRAYDLTHDYGGAPPGEYKMTVALKTFGNGDQVLTTIIKVQPDKGESLPTPELDFNNPGTNGAVQSEYVPSDMLNGSSQAPGSLEALSPGTVDQFDAQGNSITMPTSPSP